MNELHLTPLGMKAVFPINDDLCQLLGFTTPPKRVEVGVEDHFAAGWNAAVRYMREHPDPVNRQYIEVHGWSTETQRRFYAKSVHTISYKYVFREREYVTLEWIMKHLSSEQAIHYFKERGMSVCPINLQ